MKSFRGKFSPETPYSIDIYATSLIYNKLVGKKEIIEQMKTSHFCPLESRMNLN